MTTPYGQQPDPQQPAGTPDGQQPYGQQPYGGYGAPAPAAPGTGLAIAGLVTAIVPCTWLVGLVLSIVALVKVRRGTAAGRGMAIAGIVVALVWLVAGVAAFAFGIGTLIQTCAEYGEGVHEVDGVTYTCSSSF